MTSLRHDSVSMFFFAGDFAEALRRHEVGAQQSYATHGELCTLVTGLAATGMDVTVYSFVTPEPKTEEIGGNIKIVSLGADRWDRTHLLLSALASDTSSALIPHFPNLKFLRACLDTGREVMLGMANSYNGTGPKAWWERRKLAEALADPRLKLITNHCWPSTQKLADYGVPKSKLVPWDIPHTYSPDRFPAKIAADGGEATIAYVGAIDQKKGVTDLIEAVGLLAKEGRNVRARCAGGGTIEEMRAFARDKSVADRVEFLGMIGNDDVLELFNRSDLVCIPSRPSFPEGFPLTMFEGIASRTPIVCSDHPMFRPIMLDGRRASVFKAGNPASLAAAVRKVLDDPKLYESLSLNASDTWEALGGTADWRKLLTEWVVNGPASPWIKQHTLENLPNPSQTRT